MLTKSLLASAIMGAVAFGVLDVLGHTSHLWQVLVPAAAAGAVYVLLLRLLRVNEAERAWQIVWSRVHR